ncbi:hypothetical protein GGR21_002933 [Dysgonomonas hofstadii]|uniref:Putative carbohydrate metabolism domain-containing protein n=1 Tax=Dysgonomonas hofstadii TaxID=637886 RepID=A0A840CQS0_9BACT|nr:PCMD domain-containing protein [Dysgonomonas hofstadii]MBB4037019.1 hypothetical protein [Dysgonomonas hofstadii]
MNKKIFYFVLSVFSLGMFTACDDDPAPIESHMNAISFSSQYVTKQPVISGTNVTFNIAFNTPDEVLKELVPVIELPFGATVDPASGSKVDFSAGSAVFTVTSGNKFYNKSYKVSWVRDPNPDAMITEMTFASPLVVSQPVFDGTNISFEYDFYTTDAELKELVPTIALSPQATVTPASGSKVDFSAGPVEFTVIAGDKVGKTVYTVTALRAPSPEASILEITMAGDAVLTQPVIEGSNITFYVDPTDDNALKAIVPTIKISENATIDPASGSSVDFTGGTVVFTVTAQDGETKVPYNVIAKKAQVDSFEEWTEETGTYGPIPVPAENWSTSNIGVQFLMNMNVGGVPLADRLNATKTEESHSGSAAVKLETLYTKGYNMIIAKIPKVTPASLFIGKFKTEITNTLKSTKFGVSYDKKPLLVRGYYKYTPGTDFYRATGASDCHLAQVEPGTVDECAINAILYEISSENDDYLTGLDAYKSDKLVARAELKDGTAKENYTPFTIEMEYKYGKTYDPGKMYRFAIICSSSKYGDTFSGAPGSILYVDDFMVISE